MFNEIWNEIRRWNIAKIFNIHKKGNKTEFEIYREISLLVTAYKSYPTILKKIYNATNSINHIK
jgi:hypothetical protein